MTPEILWKWQAGTDGNDFIWGVDIMDDGTAILAGDTAGNWSGKNAGEDDFAAVKLSADGVEEWRWQEGTEESDWVNNVAIGEDGSAFVIGSSNGDWEGSNAGDHDFTVAKISSNGTTLWRWQDGTSASDYLVSGAVRTDGSVVVVGDTHGDWVGEAIGSSDFAVAVLDADGDEVWRLTAGTTYSEYATDVLIAEDDSIIVCGATNGELNAGDLDMVAFKLSRDGDPLWAWQSGTNDTAYLSGCTLGSDGSIYLAGLTLGDWSGANLGGADFAAAKLDADGNEMWRWQDGTPEDDVMRTAAMTAGGSLFLAGSTGGNWSSNSAGSEDFAVVQLHPNGTVLWRWQDGSSESNWITAAASSADKVVFGATVDGDWEEVSAGHADFAAIMLENTGSDNSLNPTSSPAHSPTYSPTLSSSGSSTLTQAPSPLPSSVPIPGPSPVLSSISITTPIPTPFPSVSPVIVPPTEAETKTPAPSGSGNAVPSVVSPSSPSPSSPSSSNVSLVVISSVLGAVVGVVITGLIVVLLGRRHARRSTPEAESAPRKRDAPLQ